METLSSPDHKITVQFEITVDGQLRDIFPDCPMWSVFYRDEPIILPSRLGLELDGLPRLLTFFKVIDVRRRASDTTWSPVVGERETIRDHYHEMEVELEETTDTRRRLCLVFRAYNEGVAFRYSIPEQPGLQVIPIWKEATRFQFPAGCQAWVATWAQGQYTVTAIEDIQQEAERPLLVKFSNGMWAAIGESFVSDYPRMRLLADRRRENTLKANLSGNARVESPFMSPWRYVSMGNTALELIHRNVLPLNLAPPNKIPDVSWIRPGKVMREMTLTTEGSLRLVEFARERGIDYIHFDAGWYGNPFQDGADASEVEIWDFKVEDPASHSGLDLPQVLEYAKERGIGVWLYVDQHALERQLERLVPLYAEWGIVGIKFGFVHVGPQGWTKWLVDAIELCAKHQLMVDIHDEYRPAGIQRTWPNLMNVEGICGNEEFPPPELNTTLPFTRFLDGMGDYTVCIYSPKLERRRIHQLAIMVCYFQPLCFVYWYDRPEDYQGEPELGLLEAIPTTWDETIPLQGEPGEFYVVARRSGSDWYVGGLNGKSEREVTVDFPFLGREMSGTLYRDGGEALTSVEMETFSVKPEDSLKVAMRAGGGFVLSLS